ncbi:sperm-associated antigen 1 [Cephus cinctus]|uniref:Sperm-associated antigen 1 n=1 Tax=Cephus cinctus TaxID=211228 RepID=A0AAJ7RRC2_CEPCN|nr:sperm-associated antigen 1 [Cephus cinctus]
MSNENSGYVSTSNKNEKKSLLERFDIPVEHLSYEYISACVNDKELERITLVLRSGEEGVYPDLTKHAEERLALVKPDSKVLRVEEPVIIRNMLEIETREEIENDIDSWTRDMHHKEKELNVEKTSLITDDPIPEPAIRQINVAGKERKITQSVQRLSKENRLASCDYEGWEKYDVDTELTRMDLNEECRRAEIKRDQQSQKETEERARKVSKEVEINKLSLTQTELKIMAEQEKEKGNEAFKIGDYDEALRLYNSSIYIEPTISAYNNLAITYIKLSRYDDAVRECNRVLCMEYMNIKALLRRALASEYLKKKSQALADYEAVLILEPVNKVAIAAINRLREACDSKGVRMKIKEESDDKGNTEVSPYSKILTHNNYNYGISSKQNNDCGICFCDGAPGPSKNLHPRPHIKSNYCLELENEENARKTNSYSTTMKNRSDINTGKPISIFTNVDNTKSMSSFSGIIIEEIPSEKCNPDPILENSSKTKDTMDKNNKKNEMKFGDSNEILKKPLRIEEVGKRTQRDKKNKKQFERSPQKDNLSSETIIQEPLSSNKIKVAIKYEKPGSSTKENSSRDIVKSPYEFTRKWQSLKGDSDLSMHAELLRSVTPDDFERSKGFLILYFKHKSMLMEF